MTSVPPPEGQAEDTQFLADAGSTGRRRWKAALCGPWNKAPSWPLCLDSDVSELCLLGETFYTSGSVPLLALLPQPHICPQGRMLDNFISQLPRAHLGTKVKAPIGFLTQASRTGGLAFVFILQKQVEARKTKPPSPGHTVWQPKDRDAGGGADEFRLGPQAQETSVVLGVGPCLFAPLSLISWGAPSGHGVRQNPMCFLTTTTASGGLLTR